MISDGRPRVRDSPLAASVNGVERTRLPATLNETESNRSKTSTKTEFVNLFFRGPLNNGPGPRYVMAAAA